MPIFYGKASLMDFLKILQTADSTMGFVPTMGALHHGHLALMKKSLLENEHTVVSIFVNPTQFNNPEDLAKYPRTLDEDVEKLYTLDPNIIVYAPSVDDIYEGNVSSQHFDFDGLENQMEGEFRPGHFDGVGTIVKRLFEIVAPTRAYFGEKDFQQLQIVKKMVAKQNLPVLIIGCPIYREQNDLAMSSRNERLSEEERSEAAIIYKTLTSAKAKFEKQSSTKITAWVKSIIEKNPLFKVEYFTIADETTLLSCARKNKNKKYRAFIAVLVNNIRLIDTISLN